MAARAHKVREDARLAEELRLAQEAEEKLRREQAAAEEERRKEAAKALLQRRTEAAQVLRQCSSKACEVKDRYEALVKRYNDTVHLLDEIKQELNDVEGLQSDASDKQKAAQQKVDELEAEFEAARASAANPQGLARSLVGEPRPTRPGNKIDGRLVDLFLGQTPEQLARREERFRMEEEERLQKAKPPKPSTAFADEHKVVVYSVAGEHSSPTEAASPRSQESRDEGPAYSCGTRADTTACRGSTETVWWKNLRACERRSMSCGKPCGGGGRTPCS